MDNELVSLQTRICKLEAKFIQNCANFSFLIKARNKQIAVLKLTCPKLQKSISELVRL